MFGLLTYPEARLVRTLVLELGCSGEKVKMVLSDMRGGRDGETIRQLHITEIVGFAGALLGQDLLKHLETEDE